MTDKWVKTDVLWTPAHFGFPPILSPRNCLYAYHVGTQLCYIGKAAD